MGTMTVWADTYVTGRALRRQVDQAVSRAMVDDAYARLLLADPTLAIADHACTQRDYQRLGTIRATDLVDFAQQASRLFWASPTVAPLVRATAARA